MSAHREPARVGRGRWNIALAGTGALALVLGAVGPAIGDSENGIFPTAEQVGGEVFPQPIQAGASFPTDWVMYDESGEKVDVAELIDGKRSVLAFFTTAVPMSIDELTELQSVVQSSGSDTQVLLINADTVGTALLGGSKIRSTVHTLGVIKREQGIEAPMYVAPNDALSPTGLANKLHVRSLPTVFVVDTEGKVEEVYVGRQDWSTTNI